MQLPSRNMSKTVMNAKLTSNTNTSMASCQQKFVIHNPWEALCVDLIGQHTLKGRDETEIDFMCLAMFDPATSWLKIVELLVVDNPTISTGTRGCKGYGYLWSILNTFTKMVT
jgi:hypothetical protein